MASNIDQSVAIGNYVNITDITIISKNTKFKPARMLRVRIDDQQHKATLKSREREKVEWKVDINLWSTSVLVIQPFYSLMSRPACLQKKAEEVKRKGNDIILGAGSKVGKRSEYMLQSTNFDMMIGMKRQIFFNSEHTEAIDTSEDRTNTVPNLPESPENVISRINTFTTILDPFKESLEALNGFMEVVNTISEIHPFVKAAVSALTIVYEAIKKYDQFSKDLHDLGEEMKFLLGCLQAVKDQVYIPLLQNNIISIMQAITEASQFTSDILQNSTLSRVSEAMFSSKITNFKIQFASLSDKFHKSLSVQVVLYHNETKIIQDCLKPVEFPAPKPKCMEGTRQDIFAVINQWAEDTTAKNIFWLKGSPGAGKSAIASSMVAAFSNSESKCLGAAFFFRRDITDLKNPHKVWRRIACDLAYYTSIRRTLKQVLETNGSKAIDHWDIKQDFDCLIKKPLCENRRYLSKERIIVVLDALDECGDREDFLHTIEMWSSLPSEFKLLITSRPEEDIRKTLSLTNYHDIELGTGTMMTDDTKADIQHFFQVRGEKMRNYYHLAPDIIDQLVDHAAGLFIWADTAMKFIEDSLTPDTALKLVLQRQLGSKTKVLDNLYNTILDQNIGSEDASQIIFRVVMGTIVLAKIPLTCTDIEHLLPSVGHDAIYNIIRRLSSVISTSRENSVLHISHKSFADFLLDDKHCPTNFYIDSSHHYNLARSCLEVMMVPEHGLKFNIFGISSSSVLNDDIKDLDTCFNNNVPSYLKYACTFWASHFQDVKHINQELLDILTEFLSSYLLYWIEVLSVMKQLHQAQALFMIIADMVDDSLLYMTLHDVAQFCALFWEPMSQSLPHIYLSALPFAPKYSKVSEWYMKKYLCTLTITSGQMMHWPTDARILRGHSSTVRSVVFSPDGKKVVSGSDDTTICVWDIATGQTVYSPLQGHSGVVTSVAFSPDGKQVVSGSSNGTIRVWDIATGQTVYGPLRGPSRSVASVAFSPDGKQVVSGSWDMTVRVWDIATGKTVYGPLEGHDGSVASVAFSPDGKHIISGAGDHTIRVWDTATGQTVYALRGHSGYVTSVAFSPDGKHIVSGSWDKTIRIWDIATGQTIYGPLQGHSYYVDSVAFSPDGKKVISGSQDKTIRIWDITIGKTVCGLLEGHSGSVASVAFSPDGKQVVSGSSDKTIRIWDIAAGQRIYDPLQGHNDHVASVAFSPDGKHIISGSRDNTIRVWDIATGQIVYGPLRGPSRSVASVAFSPDGKQVVSGSLNGTICVWNIATGKTVCGLLEGHNNSVASVAFSPDGKQVVSGSWDKTICVWDIVTGKTVCGLLEGHSGYVTSVAFSPDGKHIVSGSWDKTIRIWDIATGKTVCDLLEGHSDSVTSVAFSPNGKQVISGSRKTICIWDIATGKTVCGLLERYSDSVTSVAFSPDGKQAVSGSSNGVIHVWDIATGKTVYGPLKGHIRGVKSVVFSPDGKQVVSGSWDMTVRVWDIATGKTVYGPPEGHSNYVTSVAFSPDGKQVVSGPCDKTICVSNVLKEDTLRLSSKGHCLCFTDSSIMREDGWVCNQRNDLLFWVPLANRLGLWRPSTAAILGAQLTVLDFTHFVHGTSWENCRNMARHSM